MLDKTRPNGLVLAVKGPAEHRVALVPRMFAVDLNGDDDALACPRTGDTPDFPYVVHQSGPEWFLVDLIGQAEDVEWVAELDWSCAGRSGTLRIDRDGQSFRTATLAGRQCFFWDAEQPRWRRL